MDIKISNCNNIDSGAIHIPPGKLNIKYATNGIGKNTVARALSLSIHDRLAGTKKLVELTSFRNAGNPELSPKIEGSEGIT